MKKITLLTTLAFGLLVSFSLESVTPSAQGPSQNSSDKPEAISDYSDPMAFMKDFLNKNKKKDKPLKYWAYQLLLLLKDQIKDPSNIQLKRFCNEIRLANEKTGEDRIRSIQNAFINAYLKNVFEPGLSKYILDQGLPQVREVLALRAAK